MKKKNKSILIIGGTGFIGYHLASYLIKKKFKITSISTSIPQKKREIKKVKYLICDISNKEKLSRLITENYKYVINLGGHVDH